MYSMPGTALVGETQQGAEQKSFWHSWGCLCSQQWLRLEHGTRFKVLVRYTNICPESIQPCNMKNTDIYWRRCKKQTVHMLTQWHLLPPLTSTVKLSLFTHVHSDYIPWLPSYTDVTQTILIILTMVLFFQERLRMCKNEKEKKDVVE